MTLMRHVLAMVVIGLVITKDAHADDALQGLAVSKGLNGNLDADAKRTLAAFTVAAARTGSIRVWIAFDMVFVGDSTLRTAEVSYQESLVKQELIDRVVMPLVNDGYAELPPQPLPGAPGCELFVSTRALSQLARSEDVTFIGYLGSVH